MTRATERVIGIVALTRPVNGVVGIVSVFVGALLTHRVLLAPELTLACISCFFIISAGNALNDYADTGADATNKPNRPIPAGKLTKNGALMVSIILFLIGLGLSFGVSWILFTIALGASLLLLWYNFNLKGRGISGNVTVAFLGGLPFVYGGIAVKSWIPTLIPFLFAFLLHLGREILKDVEDMAGDRIVGTFSFPIKHGSRMGIRLAGVILGFLILLTPLPFIFRVYGWPYLIAVLVCIDLVIGRMIYKLRDIFFIPQANNWLKFCMIIGLGVLALGYYR